MFQHQDSFRIIITHNDYSLFSNVSFSSGNENNASNLTQLIDSILFRNKWKLNEIYKTDLLFSSQYI